MKVSTNLEIVIETKHPHGRTRRRCQQCDGFMIRIGGYEYQNKIGQNVSFILGRVCKRCNRLYINPVFKDFAIIYDKIYGGT